MAWQRFPLRDAELAFDPDWLGSEQADTLMRALRDQIAWERHRIRLFGREVDSPRLSCWIGDADAAYTYSRVAYDPRPWPDTLIDVRERLRSECGTRFNGVLANLYRDGSDRMGWHSDDEPEIDRQAPIASLSLGASRRFVLRHRSDPASRCAIELGHGSLLLMSGPMQQHWQHALPKTARVAGMRINLTFRRIVAPARRDGSRRS